MAVHEQKRRSTRRQIPHRIYVWMVIDLDDNGATWSIQIKN
ncbi:MAG: hypothetical protein VW230_02535 [Candidatus Poseidoniales archaeon]